MDMDGITNKVNDKLIDIQSIQTCTILEDNNFH